MSKIVFFTCGRKFGSLQAQVLLSSVLLSTFKEGLKLLNGTGHHVLQQWPSLRRYLCRRATECQVAHRPPSLG